MTFQPEQDELPRTGLRKRFRDTRPPVVAKSPQASAAAEKRLASDIKTDAQHASDAEVVRAGSSMAIATLISRITGFLRTVLIGSALGPAIASAFNTANTLPNLITELVLGAVLTSLVVPVLVRAEKEDKDRGAAFIRRLLTLTFSLTITITVISVTAAPLLIKMSLDDHGHVNIGMATAFAYLVLPQIVFYAMFAVFMAVLNTKGIFKPGAWAPVINNLVTLTVLGLYLVLPEGTKLQPTDSVTITNPHILLVGLGTTLGVVVQALIMVPYLRKAGIDLRPLWGLDARLKTFGGMAIAIVVYVAISQVGFVLNNRIASGASAEAPTIYMQAWQLLQVPYGVIGVTLLTAVMPRLSRNAADGDDKAVVQDLTSASKITMLALIPVIVYFTTFGTLLAQSLFAYGSYSEETANILGLTISFSAFTLIPYALVLLHLRVFYAREEVWTPTFIIAGITVTKLVLAYIAPSIASEPQLVVVLLGAANGFGFLAGVIIGDRLLRRSLGSLQSRSVVVTSLWAAGASIVGALVAFQLDRLLAGFAGGFLPPILRMVLSGVLFLVVTVLVLSRSKLPEVLMVGHALGRFLPARFRPAPPAPENQLEDPRELEVLNPTEFAARESAALEQMMGGQSMGASGMLPPMGTSAVRGPRLVPGAPLLQGRYRLLADHGGSPAARFWQARELATKRVVALTIMDTAVWDNPVQAKDTILRRSAKLKQIDSPGMSTVTRVIDYGNLVVIVSQWVEGSSLVDVAKTLPDPAMAAGAVASLADAAASADELGIALGIDQHEPLRVSLEDGAAFLAFPGVLPDNSLKHDSKGVAAALKLLLKHVPSGDIPEELQVVYRELEQLNAGPDDVDFAQVAAQLRSISGQDSIGSDIHVDADSTPDPSLKAGFGAEWNRPRNLVIAALTAFVIVAVSAALIAGLVSVLGSKHQHSPLTPDSLRQGAQSVTRMQEPSDVPIKRVFEWMPADGRGTADKPQLAGLVVDGLPDTAWETDSYLAPLGPQGAKDGVGLMLEVPNETELTQATLTGLQPGTYLEIRVAKDETSEVTHLNQTKLLRGVDVKQPNVTVALPDDEHSKKSPKTNRVLLWITRLPTPSGQATIGEVSLVGTFNQASKTVGTTPVAP